MLSKPIYVPILKWKQWAQGGLSELSIKTKEDIIPLIEIVPDMAQKQDKFIETLKYWEDRPFYFDLLPEAMDEDEYMYFNLLQQCNPNFVIPVLYISDEDDTIKYAYEFSNIGIAFRITKDDIDTLKDRLDKIISLYSPKDIDLIIDMKEITSANKKQNVLEFDNILSNISNINLYRRVILSGGSFPASLSNIDKNKGAMVDRHEYSFWIDNNKANKIYGIDLIYSDYCVSNPSYINYNGKSVTPSFNIRYTTDKKFVILKGASTKNGGLDGNNVKKFCEYLRVSSFFKGANFSWGDEYIDSRSKNVKRYGNIQTWYKVGTNHHIELIVDQINQLYLSQNNIV